MHLTRASIAAFSVAALAAPLPAQLDCARVLPGLEPPGVSGTVNCVLVFDDGTGPALHLGGHFDGAGTAGAANIAKFDGVHWSALDAGLGASEPDASVDDLVVFDFGSGPRLVASGRFGLAGGVVVNNVAAWDGASWSAIGNGLGGFALALIVFDDGAGPKLYASLTDSGVARWSGTSWDLLPSPGGVTLDLAVHDDGSGPALYAGGAYQAGGDHSVTRWTGASWTPLMPALTNLVHTLASHDDGSGRKLYAGLGLVSASPPGVVRRNGSVWENVGTIDGAVDALEVLDLQDGSGPRLHATFRRAFGDAGVARWDGSTWIGIGTGTLVGPRALAAFDGGGGARLFVGSRLFDGTAVAGFGLARLEGGHWIAGWPGRGLVNDTNDVSVHALVQHDVGSGPEIHAGGRPMFGVPGVDWEPIARWTGSGWVDAGDVPNPAATVLSLESVDLGSGRELFAGTELVGVWRRNGAGWTAFPSSPLRAVRDFQVFDLGGGPLLAAGGNSIQFGGWPRAIVRTWNGIGWTTIGENTTVSAVLALAFFDDGSGPALYCAGIFGNLNDTPGTASIARWNGTSWSSVGGGLGFPQSIEALAVFDDGSGPALYAGGRFSSIGGAPIADIARWNGSSWSPVGASGTNGPLRGVIALTVHDSGAGPTLWAGGDFTSIGGVAANRIARWNGTTWSAFGTGADGNVLELASFDEGTGSPRTLWTAGSFASIDGVGSAHVARIGCAVEPGFPFCFGDAAHGPTLCPCGNAGAPGHGCASFAAPSGAILGATGTTVPAVLGGVDSVTLVGSGMPATTVGLFFQGSARTTPAPFGDGLRCAGGTQIRLATKNASGGVARYPEPGDSPLSVRGGTPFGSGLTRYYQVWYRTATTLCTSATFNLSSAREITW